MGDIELSDGQIAVGEALTGNTVFLRLGELKLEFHRVTGAGSRRTYPVSVENTFDGVSFLANFRGSLASKVCFGRETKQRPVDVLLTARGRALQ